MEGSCIVRVTQNFIFQKENIGLLSSWQEEYEDKTISLWTWLNVTTMANPEKFINLRYKEQQQQR